MCFALPANAQHMCCSDGKFLTHVLQTLVLQLEAAAQQARLQARKLEDAVAANSPASSAAAAAALGGSAEASPGKTSSRGSVPGLQDLKGSWSGGFQAYGGGGGAANTDFDVKGSDWQWGNYRMDQVRQQHPASALPCSTAHCLTCFSHAKRHSKVGCP